MDTQVLLEPWECDEAGRAGITLQEAARRKLAGQPIYQNDNLGDRLGKWQCHKRVRAAKILAIGRFNVSPDDMLLDATASGDLLDDGNVWVSPAPDMFARYRPVPGDYYVIYDQGTEKEYRSISPADQFESGYTQICGEIR